MITNTLMQDYDFLIGEGFTTQESTELMKVGAMQEIAYALEKLIQPHCDNSVIKKE